jgi:hypothetical protein
MSLYTALWIAWLVAFVVIEWSAVKSAAHGDTLSEKVWLWFAVRESGAKYVALRRALLLMFMLWLLLHLVFGLFGG